MSNASPSVWDQANRLMVVAITLGGLAIVTAKFLPEFHKLNRLQVQTRSLEIREAQLHRTLDRLKAEYTRICSDPEYFELIARDRLDLLRPGETVFRFVDRPAAPPHPARHTEAAGQ